MMAASVILGTLGRLLPTVLAVSRHRISYMLRITLPFLLVLSSGCVTPSPPPKPATTPMPIEVRGFDAAEVAYIREVGTNRIEGNAFLRQRGGGIVTCAGETVRLVPLGGFAKRYFRLRYVEQKPATVDFFDAPSYNEHVRETRCDSDGRFSFTRVAPGDYFVETTVSWYLSSLGTQGGDIGYALQVRGDSTTEHIVISGDAMHWRALLTE